MKLKVNLDASPNHHVVGSEVALVTIERDDEGSTSPTIAARRIIGPFGISQAAIPPPLSEDGTSLRLSPRLRLLPMRLLIGPGGTTIDVLPEYSRSLAAASLAPLAVFAWWLDGLAPNALKTFPQMLLPGALALPWLFGLISPWLPQPLKPRDGAIRNWLSLWPNLLASVVACLCLTTFTLSQHTLRVTNRTSRTAPGFGGTQGIAPHTSTLIRRTSIPELRAAILGAKELELVSADDVISGLQSPGRSSPADSRWLVPDAEVICSRRAWMALRDITPTNTSALTDDATPLVMREPQSCRARTGRATLQNREIISKFFSGSVPLDGSIHLEFKKPESPDWEGGWRAVQFHGDPAMDLHYEDSGQGLEILASLGAGALALPKAASQILLELRGKQVGTLSQFRLCSSFAISTSTDVSIAQAVAFNRHGIGLSKYTGSGIGQHAVLCSSKDVVRYELALKNMSSCPKIPIPAGPQVELGVLGTTHICPPSDGLRHLTRWQVDDSPPRWHWQCDSAGLPAPTPLGYTRPASGCKLEPTCVVPLDGTCGAGIRESKYGRLLKQHVARQWPAAVKHLKNCREIKVCK